MNESQFSQAAAGLAGGSKVIGLSTLSACLAAVCAMVVVMLFTLPKTLREWGIGLSCTAISSLGGGAWATIKYGLLATILEASKINDQVTLFFALVELFGIVFLCGLPGWGIVRSLFLWMQRNSDKDIGQIVDDVKAKL